MLNNLSKRIFNFPQKIKHVKLTLIFLKIIINKNLLIKYFIIKNLKINNVENNKKLIFRFLLRSWR